MNGPFIAILISAVFTLFVLFLIGFAGDLRNKQTAEAVPITTEVPEYKMKCVKFGPNVCEEYTIYRITRN